MVNLYITSNEAYSGKTVIALGLSLILKRRGYRVGYYKPISLSTVRIDDKFVDSSIILMKHVLEMPQPYNAISPISIETTYKYLDVLTQLDGNYVLKIIEENFHKYYKEYDIVLINGFRTLTYCGLPGKVCEYDVAKLLSSNILIVVKAVNEEALGDILTLKSLCMEKNLKVLGVILNMTKHHILSRINVIEKLLRSINIKLYGIIPEISELLNPTLKEVVNYLKAEVLTCRDRLDTTYENILIGAMTPDLALTYFRRIPSKIVITGGDRADIILTALETDTKAIILTGGVTPSYRVLAKAEELGVPLLLVPYDTYTTISRVREISGKIKPEDVKRINLVEKVFTKYVNYEELIRDIFM